MSERPYEYYLAAAYDNPRKPGEGAIAYVTRLAEIVEGQPVKVKNVPSGRMPYRDDSEDTNWTGQP